MPEPVNLDSRRGWVELCGCGHRLDHLGAACHHPITVMEVDKDGKPTGERVERQCGCRNGVRTDLLVCRQNARIIERLEQVIDQQAAIIHVLTTAAGLEWTPDGKLRPAHGGLIT